ncbi:MAG TPA: hypothetical protein PK156_39260, partial [Polyangium sp.]|nr:hypothetical protein [Polyangium sp.]
MSIRKIAAALLLGVCASVASCSDGNTTNPSNSCGDDVVGGAEACDGADLAGKTCESLGLGAGTLACVADCSSLDTSQCGAPATCGDGKKDAIESCDGNDLGGQTCGGLGLGSGNLGCQLNCLGFETSNCSGPASCGNGQKDGSEVCDGNDLGGQTCESAGAGTGTLACAANCGAFDTSGCVCAPACGGLECGLDPLCGQSCGECEVGAMCDAGKCIEICDLPRITMDKVLDLDATTVTITGTVTLNGSPMPNDTKLDMKSRGRLRFRNVDTLDDYEFEFGETGAVNYTMTLFSGVYDVYVVGNLDTMQSVLPGSKAMLIQRGLELKTNSTQNFDAKTLTLSGNVTLNGAAMPNDMKLDGQPRGTLRFVNVDTLDEYTASLGETGAVTYSQKLFVGTYNIYVHGNLLPNQSVLPPDHDMLLQKNVAYSTTMTRDFDARTLTLSGKVTLNGAQMPDDTKLDLKPRGLLRLRNTETFDDYDISLLETGPANYSQSVFAGLYDVRIVSNNNIQQSVLPDAQEMVVQKGLTLSTDSVKDFDAKVLTISGVVTLNGAPMPNDTKLDGQPRGTIVFYSTEVIQKYETSLGETGPAAYSYKLFHGLYDVLIQAKTDPQQSVLPPTHAMLMQKG